MQQLQIENRISAQVEFFCPGLYLHSRTGKGILRTQLPRLRYDRRSFGTWLKKLIFGEQYTQDSQMALTITGVNHSELILRDGYVDIEIHVHDHAFIKASEFIAAQYTKISNHSAVIVIEAVESPSTAHALFRFLVFICLVAGTTVGIRLLSLLFLKNFFGT